MFDMMLVRTLADGAFHSGEALGERYALSRAAVWNRVRALQQAGIPVHAVRGKGYRIPGGLDLLDAAVIQALLPPGHGLPGELQILAVTDSTNERAMEALRRGSGIGNVVFAEQQTAGRGRRGRAWVSPFAANIYMSLSREFSGGLAALDGLSLAVGVAVCDAIADLRLPGAGLKWPNDIVAGAQKLGGVLIEVSGEVSGTCGAVIGIGLNVDMSREQTAGIDQPWTDLRALGLPGGQRNRVAALLLGRVLSALDVFAQHGLGAFLERWRSLDAIRGMSVEVLLGADRITGISEGVDEGGRLVVMTDSGRQVFHGGEVSLRRSA